MIAQACLRVWVCSNKSKSECQNHFRFVDECKGIYSFMRLDGFGNTFLQHSLPFSEILYYSPFCSVKGKKKHQNRIDSDAYSDVAICVVVYLL